jgi:hypothetical protein
MRDRSVVVVHEDANARPPWSFRYAEKWMKNLAMAGPMVCQERAAGLLVPVRLYLSQISMAWCSTNAAGGSFTVPDNASTIWARKGMNDSIVASDRCVHHPHSLKLKRTAAAVRAQVGNPGEYYRPTNE